MMDRRDEMTRALKRIQVACRKASHDLGWVCAVLAHGDEPDCEEGAREASLRIADELDELVQSIRMVCSVEREQGEPDPEASWR